jgi:hypothetical protein
MKTSVATSGQASNATISSTCPFFGTTWAYDGIMDPAPIRSMMAAGDWCR